MTMQFRAAGYFGKLPVAGDFQKVVPAEGPDGKVLEWLHDGWARYALAAQRPDLPGPLWFLWRKPGTPAAVLGAMVPSRDRAGRRFPLLVFGVATGGDGLAPVLPCGSELLARAVEHAEAGRAGLDLQALRAHVETLRTGFDGDGGTRQAEWEQATAAEAWADGTTGGLAARLRAIDYALSGGGRPNFVLRGRWQGDLRHLTAGVRWLELRAGHPAAMVLWSVEEGRLCWRLTFEYAVPGHFEAMFWPGRASPAAFDTDPGTVTIPAEFSPGRPQGQLQGSLAALLASR